MARKQSGKKKGGMAKRGRNLAKCQIYRSHGVRDKNKRDKIMKHLDKHPNDKVAKKSI